MKLQVDDFFSAAQCVPHAPEVCETCDPWARDFPQRIFSPSLHPSSNVKHDSEDNHGNVERSSLGLKASAIHRKRFCELIWNGRRVGQRGVLGGRRLNFKLEGSTGIGHGEREYFDRSSPPRLENAGFWSVFPRNVGS